MTWQYEPAPDLDQPLGERLRRFPREPDLGVYAIRTFAALLMRGWLGLVHRLEIIGGENLPQEGSFVMVSNHTSHLDTLCLLAAMPLRKLHRVFPAAAKDYFFVSAPRLALAAIVVNALPFGRQAQIRQSLELCRQLLANPGNVLIIFPEGTRTTTGELGEFKPGIASLVAGTNLPVVPCHVEGGFSAWPKGRWLPRPGKLRLIIGQAQNYADWTGDKESLTKICIELRQVVADLRCGTMGA